MLLLAVLHSIPRLNLNTTSVWIGVLGVVPWVLPLLREMFTSLKINGVGEVTFRELQQKVANQEELLKAQEEAIVTGAGGKTPAPAVALVKTMAAAVGATDQGTMEAAPEGDSAPDGDAAPARVLRDPNDPNKGEFGEKAERDGYRLSADVTPVPGSTRLFQIIARVTGARKGNEVRFHLHPSFGAGRDVVTVDVGSDGVAELNRKAWGAFTMGAEVITRDRIIRLELNLAQLESAPAAFRAR
jgi:hypothetical protein